jgi:hypothetical protein
LASNCHPLVSAFQVSGIADVSHLYLLGEMSTQAFAYLKKIGYLFSSY